MTVTYVPDLGTIKLRQENALLAEFYRTWLSFQTLCQNQADRDQLEVAAQEIVERHNKVQDWLAAKH